MTSDQSNAANKDSRKLTPQARNSRSCRANRHQRIGADARQYGPDGPAVAETATQPTIETPYGRAPLSFADIVQKVTPAVSINVKSDAKEARGTRCLRVDRS
jgi:serine protease Do